MNAVDMNAPSLPATETAMTRSTIIHWLRDNGPAFALDVAINIAAPLGIYHALQGSQGQVPALLASCLPPLVWSVVTFWRSRSVDALSVLALVGLGLSLLAMAGGGSAQFLQLREKLVTLAIALAFLGSAAIGKPLIYPLARATMARESARSLAEFDAKRDDAMVRHTVMVMTLVWGFGLLVDFLVSVALIYALSIEAYLVVGPVIGYGAMGGLALWTVLYRRYRERHANAIRAARASGRENAAQP
ncbi:VC0807 family protein [Novosphingobium rosa]|uniref:VC0807 family protein n=1 Tax=Novosphingobium rosa TaxID=76978 RepID=UPI000B23166C|nr:VC0807 family protein [Novosphingobium rosa]